MVRCKKCGHEFQSALIQSDSEDVLSNNTLQITVNLVQVADKYQVMTVQIISGNFRTTIPWVGLKHRLCLKYS